MAITNTELSALIKEMYPEGVPQDVATRKRPFLSMVNKRGGITGRPYIVPLISGFGAGRSSTIGTALTNGASSAPTNTEWQVTLTSDYGSYQIDSLTRALMSNNRGAFVESFKLNMDSTISNLGKSLSHSLFRDGTGTLGVISSIGNGDGTNDLVTLTNPEDALHFYKGMKVQGANPSGPALRDSGDEITVDKVSLSAGTVQFEENTSSTITGLTTSDLLVASGDLSAKVSGLAAWLPLTEPTNGDSFFGLDRSDSGGTVEALAGHRLAQPTYAIEENIQELSERIIEFGGRPDVCIINHRNFNAMTRSLDGLRVHYNDAGGKAKVGFDGVEVFASMGGVMVVPDADCPPNRGYLLQKDTWRLLHTGGGLPHVVRDDGLGSLRVSGSSPADAVEVRARYYAQLACVAPGWNGVFSITP